MFCARVLNGVGTGILNAITPVWATETASHTSRGQFVSIEFTLNIFGVVAAYWIELYASPPCPALTVRSDMISVAHQNTPRSYPHSSGDSPSPSRSYP